MPRNPSTMLCVSFLGQLLLFLQGSWEPYFDLTESLDDNTTDSSVAHRREIAALALTSLSAKERLDMFLSLARNQCQMSC